MEGVQMEKAVEAILKEYNSTKDVRSCVTEIDRRYKGKDPIHLLWCAENIILRYASIADEIEYVSHGKQLFKLMEKKEAKKR